MRENSDQALLKVEQSHLRQGGHSRWRTAPTGRHGAVDHYGLINFRLASAIASASDCEPPGAVPWWRPLPGSIVESDRAQRPDREPGANP
jgi:hypothetical protein